jgi:alpha-beta hydrolase superfamily lysophospholipase
MMAGWRAAALVLVLVVAGCAAPRMQPAGPVPRTATLDEAHFIAADGAVMPVRRWPAEGRRRATIVALHGFNDYSAAFAAAARRWAGQGIATIAYDQRGFGGAPMRGRWAGSAALVADAQALTRLVQAGRPNEAVYLLGDSMGGAVAMLAAGGTGAPPMAGVILVAPAVWGRRYMNVFQRATLDLFAAAAPFLVLTGRSLGIRPSDNIAMLRALARDPMMIRGARIDTIDGLVGLMDTAFDAAPRLTMPVLVLYGARDEIIPRAPALDLMRRLPPAKLRRAIYDNGYHMLLRDLGAAQPLDDIAAWITDQAAPLPSGADRAAANLLKK